MANSAATLNEFIAHVKKEGFPLANKFQVIIGGASGAGSKSVSMLCESMMMPGYNHMTNEIRRYGEIIEMPYGITYPDVPMSFYVDNTNQAKQFFDEWSNQVFHKQFRNIGFYNEYIRDIDIYLENKVGDVIYWVKLYEAYPKLVGEFQVDYANNNILKINVLIKYKWLEMMGGFKNGSSPPGPTKPTAPKNLSAGLLSGWGSGLSQNLLTGGNIFGSEPMASFTGIAGGLIGSPQSPSSTEIPSLSSVANVFSGAIPQNAYGLSALLGASSMPSGLAANASGIGNQFSTFGSNLQQVIAAPMSIVATAKSMAAQATGIASLVTSTAGQLAGIGGYVQGLTKSVGSLGRAASQLGNASSPMQALGAIQSMGSSVGQLGGAFNMVAAQAVNIANAPANVMKQMDKLGTITATAGSNLANAMNGFSL